MKRLVILGSTGSIGTQTLEVVSLFPDQFEIVGLAAHSNDALLQKQIDTYRPKKVALFDKERSSFLQGCKVVYGQEGVEEVAAMEADITVVATMGITGLPLTLQAIKAGNTIALANKEVLVAAGELVMQRARDRGVQILPIDSEHSALFQCLHNEPIDRVERLILTASGGPFWQRERSFLDIDVEQALSHPTWKMGKKITIDCSTLMNKGFEVIEAHHLFGVSIEKIDIVIHPQSIIHSLVEFVDGSTIAQMSKPSMLLPIHYALFYPLRKATPFPRLNLTQISRLEFFTPDEQRSPCLALAYTALRLGGDTPCYLNGANEILVERFLKKELRWQDIASKLEKLMNGHTHSKIESVEQIYAIDREARDKAALV